ncbi:MAG TPA: hypothetical protein PKY81_14080 [bacterium]|nr:hypothetical protein [bacterium]HPN32075.1 hypothetical protein [bacterium]
MENDSIPVQCYKCKKVKDEFDKWELPGGKTEHIEFANHTICPECIRKTQSEMQVKYIFNEFASRVSSIFKNLSICCFSDANSLKNNLISSFSKSGIKIQLFEQKDLFSKKNFEPNCSTVFIIDIDNENQFNAPTEVFEKNCVKIFIIDKTIINFYLKFAADNTDYIFKNFAVEELICKIYFMLTRQKEKKNDSDDIKKLKSKKMELLNQLMIFQDSDSASNIDALKTLNDKLKMKLDEMKKNVGAKNIQIMELSEKIEESEIKDKTTGLKNFYGFYDCLCKESKKFSRQGYSAVIAEIKFKVLTGSSEQILYSSPPEDYFLGYEEYCGYISVIIKKYMERNNFIARISFNKIILVIPEKNMENAIPVIEKIETEINQYNESAFSAEIKLYEIDDNSGLENILMILEEITEAE